MIQLGHIIRDNEIDTSMEDIQKYLVGKMIRSGERKPCRKVITLCGSSKFRDIFIETERYLTKKGYCIILPYWDGFLHRELYTKKEWAGQLAEIHFKKIDLSDEVFVINVGGYIGEDTQKDIEYAKQKGIKIKFLEAVHESEWK